MTVAYGGTFEQRRRSFAPVFTARRYLREYGLSAATYRLPMRCRRLPHLTWRRSFLGFGDALETMPTRKRQSCSPRPQVTPFVLDYDLMVLAPAVVLMMQKIARDGPLPWEKTILGFATVMPLVAVAILPWWFTSAFQAYIEPAFVLADGAALLFGTGLLLAATPWQRTSSAGTTSREERRRSG